MLSSDAIIEMIYNRSNSNKLIWKQSNKTNYKTTYVTRKKLTDNKYISIIIGYYNVSEICELEINYNTRKESRILKKIDSREYRSLYNVLSLIENKFVN